MARMVNRQYPEWFVGTLVLDSDKEKALDGSLTTEDIVTQECSKHGRYTMLVKRLIRLSTGEPREIGCPLCKKEEAVRKSSATKRSKRNFSDIVEDLAFDSDKKRALSGDMLVKEKVAFLCRDHNEVYYQRVVDHRKASGCLKCRKISLSNGIARSLQRRRRYPQWFIDELVNSEDKERAKSGELSTQDKVEFKCDNHGVYTQYVGNHIKFSTGERISGCPKCVVGNFRSSIEEEIVKFIEEVAPEVKIITNIKGVIEADRYLELDIYIPDKKLAIEVNGSYYHQTCEETQKLRWGVNTKSKNYHQMKFLKCQDKGIRLIQVFDVDWHQKKNKIKNIIRDAIVDSSRLQARKLDLVEISSKEANEFYGKYHLQNGSNRCSINIALKQENLIVSVMSFGVIRFRPKDGWYELVRYCVSPGYTIVGGPHRLLKYFLRRFCVNGVLTYSDNNFFTGRVYKDLGFSFDGLTQPGYYWTKDGIVKVNREEVMPKVLREKYPDLYSQCPEGENKEEYVMNKLRLKKVYMAGNKRWIKVYKEGI